MADTCMHDYSLCLLLGPRVDPSLSESLLQKTSPSPDPAAIHQLSTELTAQASVLAAHQQQLHRLTSLTEELVKTLQTLPLPSAGTSVPPLNPGSPARCKGFLLQCSLFVNQQPMLYPTDSSRIAFVCSLLTGKALDWVTAVWKEERVVIPTFAGFLHRFREVFEHPTGGEEVGEQLLSLQQGRDSVAEYALIFRTLAAQTGWQEAPLKLLFRKGLNTDLQSELACRDDEKSLDQFIELAIRVDNLVRVRRSSRQVNFPAASAAEADTCM